MAQVRVRLWFSVRDRLGLGLGHRDKYSQERGRMPDSQSSEPGFESPFATISKIGHFFYLH